MRKQIVITLLVTAFLGTAGIAQAGDWNRGHHNQSRGHHNQYRAHYNRPYRQNSNYGYRRGRNSGYYRYRRGQFHHHNGLKIAAGALILGSAIYAANNNWRRNVVYRSRPVSINRGSWFRVDSDGQCVEVTLNRQGQEVWTYVDSGYCY